MTMHWGDFVAEKTKTHGEFVLGVDPVLGDIPSCFKKAGTSHIDALAAYTSFLLDTTHDLIGFAKFQSAFFEAFGISGIKIMADGIAFLRQKGIGVILDAKRGDIGSTAAAYASAYLTPASAGSSSDIEADCLTVNPFLGPDTLEPFVSCATKYGKGLFVLVKTSNPGSGWLQDKEIEGARVSDRVAKLVAEKAAETMGASGLACVGAVVGATYPEDSARLRGLMPASIILAPGLGAQGGKAEDICALRRPGPSGVLVPVSRGITKVKDLDISKDDYAKLLRERVTAFKTDLS